MSSLYEIDKDLQEMIECGFNEKCINLETGEIDDKKVQEYLDSLPIERDKKLEAYGCYIKNLKAEQEAIEKEIKVLEKRRDTKKARITYLTDNVTKSMLAMKETKKEFTKCVLSFRKSTAVDIKDSQYIPKEFLKIETTEKPMLKEITKYLNNGGEIKGVSLVNKQNLQVK